MAAITIRLDLPAHFLDLREQRAGFVLLTAFLVSFLFIRTSARLMRSPRVPWWPGSVTTSGGVHLHHLVWGTVLVLVAGFVAFVTPDVSPWHEILAGVFGVGAGLTLDEFALLIHLRDVYWAEEGRASFDAVIVAAILGGLIVVGFAPFDLKNSGSSVGTLAFAVGTDLLLSRCWPSSRGGICSAWSGCSSRWCRSSGLCVSPRHGPRGPIASMTPMAASWLDRRHAGSGRR